MSLGFKVRRLQAGYRQWELAKALDISESTLSKIESGRKACEGWVKIELAKLLGCTPDELMEMPK